MISLSFRFAFLTCLMRLKPLNHERALMYLTIKVEVEWNKSHVCPEIEQIVSCPNERCII